jgi:putative ABC transport system permease protein
MGSDMSLVVRAAHGKAEDLLPRVRERVLALDPHLPLFDAHTMEQRVESSIVETRMTAWLMSLLAALTLGMAAMGIYGAIWHTIVERTREIGIRLALGATPRQIGHLFGRRILPWASAGIAVGVGGALLLSQTMEALLFEVHPFNFKSLSTSLVVVSTVILWGTYWPTRRATRRHLCSVLKGDLAGLCRRRTPHPEARLPPSEGKAKSQRHPGHAAPTAPEPLR